MSTISRSPGSAPSTAIGPLSTCTPGSGALRMSSAESSLWIAPSNHSRQSTRNTSPGLTWTWAGMSGCQRLWPTICWSVNFFVESRGNTTWGTGDVLPSGSALDRGEGSGAGEPGVPGVGGGAHGTARARRRDAAHDLRGLGAALAGLDRRAHARARALQRGCAEHAAAGAVAPRARRLVAGGHRADQVEGAAGGAAVGVRRHVGSCRPEASRPTLLRPE